MYEKWVCVTNPFKGVFGRKKLFNRNNMYILRSLIKDKLQKKAYERSEIIRAHYLGIIGESYIQNQLIFINKSAKNERSLLRFYGYSSQNIRACKKMVPIMNPYPGLRYCVIFLPPYSPDYNPIETAFSVIKSWIKCNCDFMEACNDLIYSLLVACGQITPQMTDEMVQFMIKERKDNNDYYHTLVKGGKKMFWEDVVMKVNLKYKSRFIGSQVKEKFQGIIRDCRIKLKYDIKHHKNVEKHRKIVTLSEERNLEEEDLEGRGVKY
ncbi:homeodomain-like protein [Rhizophagus clarus]|uniref:Homeodomain-like protein n=1 Tax=Rhizophagus clarus TaxID=94130 RepID=A0A8H3R3D3_9GLOM|nr:homeodomain-like protein [Rhizophagus clarus]